MKRAAHLYLILALSCTASTAGAADGASNYPNRPIRFIDAFVPGGPSDILSRLLGQKLTEAWGQPVVIENRGSAGGIVGTEVAAKSAPDGYTLLLAAQAPITINPSVYVKLPYDPLRDFQPVTQISSGAYLMVVNPSVAAKSVPDFIALAKAKPGQINYASTGANNLLAMEMFNHMAGVKTENIAYKGAGQALNALLAGEVQVFVISPLVGLPQMKAGKLRAIGLTGSKRSPMLPDLPTVAETLPGFESIVWHGVVVPAKTPRPIVDKLAQELIRIVRTPEIKDRLNGQGLDALGTTPDEFSALIKNEVAMFAKLVKQIGFKPQ
ncbi:MAG: Bug family tripartite tricarboxylate transporter substrate binding protein [Burkholderiales bacterium]